LIATQNYRNSDDADDFPEIDGLLSGIRDNSMPASADPNGGDGDDDDGFIDIDELLAAMRATSGVIIGWHTYFPES
jgi:hypothetical protein